MCLAMSFTIRSRRLANKGLRFSFSHASSCAAFPGACERDWFHFFCKCMQGDMYSICIPDMITAYAGPEEGQLYT